MSDSIAFGGLKHSDFKQSRAVLTRDGFDSQKAAAAVRALFGLALVNLWDSYDFDTQTWTDSVGGEDATPTVNAPPAAIINGHSYPVFDGIDTALDAVDTDVLDGRSDWCIFSAFKTNAADAYGAIIDKGGQFYVEFSGQAFYVSGQAGAPLDGAIVVNDDQWHRVIISVIGNAATLYVDGVVDVTATMNTLSVGSTDAVRLGGQPGPPDVANSSILVVGIATSGLDAGDVATLDDILFRWTSGSF